MSTELATATKTTDKLLAAGVFSLSDVEILSAKLNEPEWLQDKRRVSWTVLTSIGGALICAESSGENSDWPSVHPWFSPVSGSMS